jgi:hypothetical protein
MKVVLTSDNNDDASRETGGESHTNGSETLTQSSSSTRKRVSAKQKQKLREEKQKLREEKNNRILRRDVHMIEIVIRVVTRNNHLIQKKPRNKKQLRINVHITGID